MGADPGCTSPTLERVGVPASHRGSSGLRFPPYASVGVSSGGARVGPRRVLGDPGPDTRRCSGTPNLPLSKSISSSVCRAPGAAPEWEQQEPSAQGRGAAMPASSPLGCRARAWGPPGLTNRLPRPHRPGQSGAQALEREPIGQWGETKVCAPHPKRPHEGATGSAEAAGAFMWRLPQLTSKSSQVLHPLPHRRGPPEGGSPRDTILLHVPPAYFSKTCGRPVPPGATASPQDRDRTGPWFVLKSGLGA